MWPQPPEVLGSIRRECLNHVIVINDRHLKRILRSYLKYYHTGRTHLSLNKDPPEHRPIEWPDVGKIVKSPQVGGLHHRYFRVAA